VPVAAAERAPWAPAEGEQGCAAYLQQMLAHFPS